MKISHSLKFTWRPAAYTVAAMFATVSLPSTAAAASPLVSKASGLCLDLVGSDATAGAAIDIWGCNGGSNQQWEFTAAGEVRTLNGTRCLDAFGGGTAAGTKVISWTCSGGANQKWTLQGNGQLVGQASGLCVDVVGNGTANGTAVGLWTCHGGNNQIWTKGGATNPGTPVGTSDNPDFGPNVTIFDQSVPSATIQAQLDAAFKPQVLNPNAQFGSFRRAFLFKPGRYSGIWANLGFYTSIVGLGQSPDDVNIQGNINVDSGWNYGDAGNATQNFWRSAENVALAPTGGTNRWAVSQAAPMRRVHVIGNLHLGPSNQDFGQGYSSGGYLADSKVDGSISSGSQQQWYTRDSNIGVWYDGVWNIVFSGVQGAPAQSFPAKWNTASPYTTLNTTPVSREKPFLYIDGSGKYRVFVPALRTNSSGASWVNGSTAGSSIPMSQFFVAKPSDSAATLNNALAQGLNLFLTPGTYHLNQTLKVTRANTVVLGIGFPTLVPDNGVDGMAIDDVDGVKIAGVLFDAGTVNSQTLLTVGQSGSAANHSGNPTTIQDVFFRIGGAVAGKATNSLIVNSNNTIIDHIWAWRADHGISATGWNVNTADYGVVVNGRDVLATGLFVEHYQKFQVLWNGENGKTVFFQNEMPYDVPNQGAWKSNGSTNGYAAYKVADNVKTHEGWGLGSYCFFNTNPSTNATRGFEVPNTSGVRLHSVFTVSLGGVGTISHVVNNTGDAAQGTSTIPVNLVNFP